MTPAQLQLLKTVAKYVEKLEFDAGRTPTDLTDAITAVEKERGPLFEW